jgi:formamidopyrimidine-DNA glycosylase
MPELPEVETTRLTLLPHVKGQKILRVELKRDGLRVPFPKGFAKRLTGKTVLDIRRRAKYLLFDLDSGESMLGHLGMSGSFLITKKGQHSLRKHDHVLFYLSGGDTLIYHDPRRFGFMELLKTGAEGQNSWLAHLGPEPLSKEFSASYLKNALAGRKGPIKPVLMDQKLVVGVGNIYASESLFLAGVHPTTPAHLAATRAEAMVKAIQKSLKAALKSGGSTLRDFTSGEGAMGYFQHQFNVYEREGEPCVACGHEIQCATQAGRSTYYCNHCQTQPMSKSGKKKIFHGEKAKK